MKDPGRPLAPDHEGVITPADEREAPAGPVLGKLSNFAGKVASLLTSGALNKFTTFAMYALVARYLGAFEFGQLALALTLFYTFQVLAIAGLKTLITREVAKNRDLTGSYLINGSAVVMAATLLAMLLLLLLVRSMNYAPETAKVILLLSSGLLPYALAAICEAVFQAWERMRYIAYANLCGNLAKLALIFLALSMGDGIRELVLLVVASQAAIAAIEWWFVLRGITRPRLRLDLGFALSIARRARTFLGIDVVIAIWSSVPIILLSKLAGETEVGFFGAATQLMVPVNLVFQSIVLSIFPIMCRRFKADFQNLKRISENLLELLLLIALPMATGLFFLAGETLLLLYGDREFLQAVPALRIMVWLLVVNALTQALGQALLAGMRERITLRIVVLDTLAALGLGLLLIPRFGLLGAALAALLTGIINFFQHYFPVARLMDDIALGKFFWKPGVACLGMAGILLLVGEQGILLKTLYASATYAVILFMLEMWSAGNSRRLGTRFRHLWLESD